MEIKNVEERGRNMLAFAKELFPYCRSILGPDIRKSLNFFKNKNNEFKTISFKTGEKVFDWEIPKEWSILDGYIEHESGIRFAEFKKNNLHVVGYSHAVNMELDKKDLIKHINIIPEKPNAIPYCTSYYKDRWGFCLDKNTFDSLPEGNYKVFIDSKLEDGELHLIEAKLKGRSKKEIFFSSYLCHPSMANNELSGPVLVNELITYIKENYPNRKYSYRFVLLPETIGSIAYLSKRYKLLKDRVICGFALSCVGDERKYSHIESRKGENLADKALSSALIDLPNKKKYSFLDRGSDERQYCAPGIDLPLCTFCRSKFGTYHEYHTSLDNFDVVTSKGLSGSFEIMKNIIDTFEICLRPKLNVLCEPQLSKRGLYPTFSNDTLDKEIDLRMNVLAYADSENTFEIANKLGINLGLVLEELKLLISNKIIS